VTYPPLPQPKLVLDLATPEGCRAELTWVVVIVLMMIVTGDLDLKLTDRYLTDANSLRDLPALTTYQRRGSLQLWQFLIALLENPANTSFIAWTGRGLEFKLIEPEEVRDT